MVPPDAPRDADARGGRRKAAPYRPVGPAMRRSDDPDREEGMSQQALAERLYVTKGNISGLIDRLVAAGLVERRPIVADKRQYALYLTAAGRSDGGEGDRRPIPLDRLDPRAHGRGRPRSTGDAAHCAARHRPRAREAVECDGGQGVSGEAPFPVAFRAIPRGCGAISSVIAPWWSKFEPIFNSLRGRRRPADPNIIWRVAMSRLYRDGLPAASATASSSRRASVSGSLGKPARIHSA